MKKNINELKNAIKNMHDCNSKWVKSIPIKETFQKQIVWEGIVEVFTLLNHPTAKKCYAWFFDDSETGKRRFIAVLHQGPIDSPKKAVKAAIVREYQKQSKGGIK